MAKYIDHLVPINNICNQSCNFCSAEYRMEWNKPIPLKNIFKQKKIIIYKYQGESHYWIKNYLKFYILLENIKKIVLLNFKQMQFFC